MTKNDLINIIINSPTINNTLNTIRPVELRDDFRQHFYLQLCEITEEKLLQQYQHCEQCLERYAGAIIRNQLKSDNSSFYKLYRQKNSIPDATTHYYDILNTDTSEVARQHREEQLNIEAIQDFLRALHPKKTTLFKEYYFKGKTIREISKKYNIKYRTVHYTIRETEKLIRRHLQYKEGN